MNTNIYIYMNGYILMFINIYIYLFIHLYLYIHLFIHIYISIHIYFLVFIYSVQQYLLWIYGSAGARSGMNFTSSSYSKARKCIPACMNQIGYMSLLAVSCLRNIKRSISICRLMARHLIRTCDSRLH